VLQVPVGEGDLERVVRAHELLHARVSPHDVNPLAVYPDLDPRALECAEEFRVNYLLGRLAFKPEQLRDGSELVVGERLAAAGQWAEVVAFFVATIGTGAEKEFLRGVRRVTATWQKPLGVVRRQVLALVNTLRTSEIGSTQRSEQPNELPDGFRRITVPVARVIAIAGTSVVPLDATSLRQFRRALEPGGRRAPSGVFAPLVLSETLEVAGRVQHCSARRSSASATGTSMRYPSRLLTDPHRRAFGRPTRARGGIVIIDQSGSMDLDSDELDRLLLVTPAATVVGYSHRPGDRSGVANAWVVAANGRRASRVPSGNVGNGVDGPVLRWALERRHHSEVVVWVTDGQVTDSNDHPSAQLALDCARLVLRHRVCVVRALADASGPLRGRRDHLEPLATFGRLGRASVQLRSAGPPQPS
jgi:hypothetical protein